MTSLHHVGLFTLALGSIVACGGSAFDSKDNNGLTGLDGGADAAAGGASGGRAGSTGGAAAGGAAETGGKPAGGSSSGGSASGGSPQGGTANGGSPQGGTANGGGGPGTTTLRASDYDQACKYDGECHLVIEGDVCGCPGCPNAAIAATAMPEWDADRSAIECTGPALPCPEILCVQALPACVSGACAARQPIYVTADRYDASCKEDSDCKVIQTGEVCSACKCSAVAVNLQSYAQYLKDIAPAHCTPGPGFCDCATIDVAHCETSGGPGTCRVGL